MGSQSYDGLREIEIAGDKLYIIRCIEPYDLLTVCILNRSEVALLLYEHKVMDSINRKGLCGSHTPSQ